MKSVAYKIKETTFEEMQKEAGLLLTYFDENNPYEEIESEHIFCATDGGIHVHHEAPMNDLGEGVDNCPTGMKELMEKTDDNISIEFTSLTFNAENIAMSLGAADVELKTNGSTHIYPRKDLKSRDFKDLWWIGPMKSGGLIGAKFSNCLSSNGLDVQTTKNDRGTNAFTITPHPSIYAQNVVPARYFIIPPPTMGTIRVTSAAGTATGTSTITVSNYTPATGESYKYKVGTAIIDVEYGDIIGADWTAMTSPATVTATSGKKITVVSVDSDGYAVAVGSATITAKA